MPYSIVLGSVVEADRIWLELQLSHFVAPRTNAGVVEAIGGFRLWVHRELDLSAWRV